MALQGEAGPLTLDDINKVYSKFDYKFITTVASPLSIPGKMYLYRLPYNFLSGKSIVEQIKSWIAVSIRFSSFLIGQLGFYVLVEPRLPFFLH